MSRKTRFGSLFSGSRNLRPRRRKSLRSRFTFENLEDRRMMATFSVVNTDDAGTGSLREALIASNDAPGADTIEFNIPGAGMHVIELQNALPRITDAVSIDGGGQITLDGSQAGYAGGLEVAASNSSIVGLTLEKFSQQGLKLSNRVDSLTDVDALVAGQVQSTVYEGSIDQADLFDLSGGSWSFDNSIPGGGGDDYGFVARGKIAVKTAGTYSFAIGSDDGGRLRIDGDDVIVDYGPHGFQNRFGSVDLMTGTHEFEWTGFERAGGAGFELSVAVGENSGPVSVANGWCVVGDDTCPGLGLGGINLSDALKADGGKKTATNKMKVEVFDFDGEASSVLDIITPVGLGSIPSTLIGTTKTSSLNLDDVYSLLDSKGVARETFAARYTGVFDVAMAGEFYFSTTSDDGSLLYVDGELVVDNDGLHGRRTRQGVISLTEGEHTVVELFYEQGGGQTNEFAGFGGPVSNPEIVLDGSIDVTAYYATPVSHVLVTDNVANNNRKDGFSIFNSEDVTLTGNVAEGNGRIGFLLVDSNDNTLTDNTAASNPSGFVLARGDNNVIERNTAADNFWEGIYIEGGDNNTLTDNTSDRNVFGITVRWNHNATLKGNTVEGNSRYGFLLDGNNSSMLKGNTAKDNGRHGFLIQNSDNNTFIGNSSEDNDGDGFHIEGSGNNTFKGNTADGNVGDGFHLASGDNNTFKDNKAKKNDGWGFYVDAVLSNVFDDNECVLNGLGDC